MSGDVHVRLDVTDEKGIQKLATDMLVRTATLPDSGPTGVFFCDRLPIPW